MSTRGIAARVLTSAVLSTRERIWRSATFPVRRSLFPASQAALGGIFALADEPTHRLAHSYGIGPREILAAVSHLAGRPYGQRSALAQSFRECLRLGQEIVVIVDSPGQTDLAGVIGVDRVAGEQQLECVRHGDA